MFFFSIRMKFFVVFTLSYGLELVIYGTKCAAFKLSLSLF